MKRLKVPLFLRGDAQPNQSAQLIIPLLEPDKQSNTSNETDKNKAKLAPKSDVISGEAALLIAFVSIGIREFLATYCFFLLGSRLGPDLFIARPLVFAYISVMFRRPMINPLVTLFACTCAYHWKKANICGYPYFQKDFVPVWRLTLYALGVITLQLAAALAAAETKLHHGRVFGDEFLRNAAWGAGQLRLRPNAGSESCWVGLNETSIHNMTTLRFDDDNRCITSVRGAWWFTEELASALFLLASYVHIWKWLRWDDVDMLNPADDEERYWMKIVAFSTATGAVGLMSAMAFPTSNTGWHVSLYQFWYQRGRADLTITSNDHGEPWIRMAGGLLAYVLVAMYEGMIVWVDHESLATMNEKNHSQAWYMEALHILVYTFPQCWHKGDSPPEIRTLDELVKWIKKNEEERRNERKARKASEEMKGKGLKGTTSKEDTTAEADMNPTLALNLTSFINNRPKA